MTRKEEKEEEEKRETLRDVFAAAALIGILNTRPNREVNWQTDVAWDAYSIAEVMMKERDRVHS